MQEPGRETCEAPSSVRTADDSSPPFDDDRSVRRGSLRATLHAVFGRLTERGQRVIVFAQVEARTLKHGYIGTEHILLGLLREEEGLAARVLDSLDITVDEVRARVTRIVGQKDEVTTDQAPFTPRAKRVLQLAQREALSLGHRDVGPEHILLGILRENEGAAARILLDLDVVYDKIRNEVIRMLSGPGPSVRIVQRRERGRAESDPPEPTIMNDDAEPPPEMRTFRVTFHRANPNGTHETLGLKVNAESPDEALEMDYRGQVPDRYLTADVRRTAEQIPYEEWRV